MLMGREELHLFLFVVFVIPSLFVLISLSGFDIGTVFLVCIVPLPFLRDLLVGHKWEGTQVRFSTKKNKKQVGQSNLVFSVFTSADKVILLGLLYRW